MSFILWDYVISFDDEVNLFWSSRRSWIKFLFFVNRYLGLILRLWDALSERYELNYSTCGAAARRSSKEILCVFVDPESIIYVTIQLVVIGIILILRVWVITGNQRWILWSFFGLLACTASVSVVLFVLNLRSTEATVIHFVLSLVFEGTIFTAAAYHGIKDWRNRRSLLSSGGDTLQPSPEPIMQLMFQDSVIYFLTALLALPQGVTGPSSRYTRSVGRLPSRGLKKKFYINFFLH
ncbi:uncharacterized protein EV420DRAFT_681684 [Desarmillaria tabescens]|uniref:DUF6533 domain-containing protein n=1 Tax=Armillaria tabescens TaxID=1929756 RepID=A0AA39MZK8_ARMTA|nr:uncharacterized protein EV420DRAFT_681684 [Desarmillaria tabescens]KAK0452761.1 hypothetical protein EV420DRAFT_681684 [Desarmillaria tabescens]